MAFTKIAAAGISSTGIITLENISVSGVTTSSGGFVGNLTGNATGLSGTPNITVGSITAASASFSGNISVAGTVTYEDVTNVDSVGVITARNGLVINSGGLRVTGVTTVSSGSASAPSISPTGDSNTGIFFPAADTIAFAEGGVEGFRLDSNGRLGIGTDNPVVSLDLFKASYPELNVRTGTITGTYGIDTATNTTVIGSTTNHPLSIRTSGVERINLASTGNSTFYTNSTFDASNYFYLQNNTNSYGRIGLVIRGKTFNGANTPSPNDGWSLGSGRSTVRFEAYLTGDTDYDPKFSIQHLLATSTNAAVGDLGFLAKGYSTTAPAMVLTAGGNLGLGVANPSHKLSVYGTGAVRNEIVCTDNNAGGAGVYLRTLNSGTQVSNATLRTTNSGTLEVYTGTTSETLKLSIDSTGYVSTPNNLGAGLDIGYKKVVTITGNFSANTWYNTGIDRTTDTGIYLLNAYVDTYNTGQSYQMTYTGLFALPNRGSNSGDATSITLHRAGHAPNAETIQFRTLLTPAASDSKIYLQWLSNFNLNLDGSGGRNIQVAIHRLTSALNN